MILGLEILVSTIIILLGVFVFCVVAVSFYLLGQAIVEKEMDWIDKKFNKDRFLN